MIDKWTKRFFDRAFEVGSWSKDPKRKVGAIVVSKDNRVLAEGYNGFPKGLNLQETQADLETKLAFTVHAEVNCIIGLLANHKSIYGPRDNELYLTTAPCIDCAKFLAATTDLTNIKVINFMYNDLTESKWKDSIAQGLWLLESLGYELVSHKMEI